jgi:hypothetical protein
MAREAREVESKTGESARVRGPPHGRPRLVEVIKLDERDSGRVVFSSNDGCEIGWE